MFYPETLPWPFPPSRQGPYRPNQTLAVEPVQRYGQNQFRTKHIISFYTHEALKPQISMPYSPQRKKIYLIVPHALHPKSFDLDFFAPYAHRVTHQQHLSSTQHQHKMTATSTPNAISSRSLHSPAEKVEEPRKKG